MPSKIDRVIDNIEKNLNFLRDNKIPYLFTYKADRKLNYCGTQNAVSVFEENKSDFEKSLNDDIKILCDPSHSTVADADERPKPSLEVMKAPLSLSNNDQIKKYVRYLIVHQHDEKFPSTKERNIKYGDPDWEPTFWPRDIVAWNDIKNFSNVRKKDLPDGYSMLDILREVIRRGLTEKGLNPETFFDHSTFTSDVRIRRMKNRGLHCQPELPADDHLEASPDIESIDINEREAPSISFIPRRPLPAQNSQTTVQRSSKALRSLPNFLPLPTYLEKYAPGLKIKVNPGAGLCLAYSVAQFCEVDPIKLKEYANQHLFTYFDFYRDFMTFPVTVQIGTGIFARLKTFKDEFMFCDFLLTKDAIYAWNTGEVEILVLAKIIGQQIKVVDYKQQGFPEGTPIEERCGVKYYPPMDYNYPGGPYRQESEPTLLYEDTVHFSLLVPEYYLDPSEVTDFIDDLHLSLFPQHDANDIRELPMQSTLKSNLDLTSVSPAESISLSNNSSSTLRRSQRVRKKKEIFDNSEPKRKKRTVSKSVSDLLKPCSKDSKEEEARIQREHEERMKRIQHHEEEMAKLDAEMMSFREHLKQKRSLADKLQVDHVRMREELTGQSIKLIIKDNIDKFKSIKLGTEYSWRHNMFFEEGNRAMKERHLLTRMIADPFSDEQLEMFYDDIRRIWLDTPEEQLQISHYINLVLYPEIPIIIYRCFL